MKVFASQFLESYSKGDLKNSDWKWKPDSRFAQEIYATGAPTSTQQSTYAAETDDRSDSDRPDEGGQLMVA